MSSSDSDVIWTCGACTKFNASRENPAQCSACGAPRLPDEKDSLDYTYFTQIVVEANELEQPFEEVYHVTEQSNRSSGYYEVTRKDDGSRWFARIVSVDSPREQLRQINAFVKHQRRDVTSFVHVPSQIRFRGSLIYILYEPAALETLAVVPRLLPDQFKHVFLQMVEAADKLQALLQECPVAFKPSFWSVGEGWELRLLGFDAPPSCRQREDAALPARGIARMLRYLHGLLDPSTQSTRLPGMIEAAVRALDAKRDPSLDDVRSTQLYARLASKASFQQPQPQPQATPRNRSPSVSSSQQSPLTLTSKCAGEGPLGAGTPLTFPGGIFRMAYVSYTATGVCLVASTPSGYAQYHLRFSPVLAGQPQVELVADKGWADDVVLEAVHPGVVSMMSGDLVFPCGARRTVGDHPRSLVSAGTRWVAASSDTKDFALYYLAGGSILEVSQKGGAGGGCLLSLAEGSPKLEVFLSRRVEGGVQTTRFVVDKGVLVEAPEPSVEVACPTPVKIASLAFGKGRRSLLLAVLSETGELTLAHVCPVNGYLKVLAQGVCPPSGLFSPSGIFGSRALTSVEEVGLCLVRHPQPKDAGGDEEVEEEEEEEEEDEVPKFVVGLTPPCGRCSFTLQGVDGPWVQEAVPKNAQPGVSFPAVVSRKLNVVTFTGAGRDHVVLFAPSAAPNDVLKACEETHLSSPFLLSGTTPYSPAFDEARNLFILTSRPCLSHTNLALPLSWLDPSSVSSAHGPQTLVFKSTPGGDERRVQLDVASFAGAGDEAASFFKELKEAAEKLKKGDAPEVDDALLKLPPVHPKKGWLW